MKCLLSALLFFLLLPTQVNGQQNLVSNGSFEDTVFCPPARTQFAACSNWTALFNRTPDYYHACNPAIYPITFFGSQYAADGNAYVGLCPHSIGTNFEYIKTEIQPLQIGMMYEVSLSVNLAGRSMLASNNIGILFCDSTPSNTPPASIWPSVPQVHFYNYGTITDTLNWVRLRKIFIADSAYKHLVIGGFYDSNYTYDIDTLPYNGSGYPYYFIDSVVLKQFYPFDIGLPDSSLCSDDTISINCIVESAYNPTNIFTAQLSNHLGDFNNPINIGIINSDTSVNFNSVIPGNVKNGTGYRIRIISSSPADTSIDNRFDIKIHNPDSSAISIATNSPACEGNTLSLTASTNVTPTTYSWTGPSGFNSTLQNPVINGAVPANSGDYYATLKFYGCEVKDTLSVTVKPLPAKPVAGNNSPLCAGDSLHLSSVSSTTGVNYSWAGPGSFASSTQDTSVANSTVAMSGDYIVTADLNGCNRKDTTTVLVKPLPAAVTLSNNGPLCAGDTLHLSSTASTTGSTYSWTGPGSFSATTQNTNRVNTIAGMTGWYKMLVDLNGCSFVDSTYATVYPIPAMPNINYSNPLCIGETLNLGTATVSGATYSWTGPGNYAATVQNPARTNMQFGDTGSYKLHITVNGCGSETAAATVHINPLPFVVIFPTPGDSICVGDRVNFTALPNNHSGSPAYQWFVNGQASGTGTVFSTTTLNDLDVVRCDMTENTKCKAPYTDPSNDITMNVLPWLAPSVSISANPNRPLKENEYVTFTATATNAGNSPQYQWKRNGQDIVGATGAVWSANTLSDNDNISVAIISNYKCPQPTNAVSNIITVKVLTGVAGLDDINGLSLYPNPNNGKFVLKGRLNTGEIAKLEVINTVGKVVFEDTAITESGNIYHEIALPCVPPGIYMLRIKASEQLAVFKVEVR